MGDTTEDRGLTGRRAVLAGFGGAAALAALAGCGTASNQSSGDSSGGATGAATTGAAAPTSAAASAPNNGHAGGPLAQTSEIPVGGGKIFADASVVVTQPTAGQFKAFSSICTHQQCPVTSVSGGTINCPCHGSKYSITDGSVKAGPAPKPLPAKTVNVANGAITVA